MLICMFLCSCTESSTQRQVDEFAFDGARALEDAIYQVNLGPRIPGSEAHQKTINWLNSRLTQNGWTTSLQRGMVKDHEINNLIAEFGDGKPWIILGAHFDTRPISNREVDLEKISTPVPGANDGASGVSVLLEISRILPDFLRKNGIEGKVSLVFFDMEESGGIAGKEYSQGSSYYVEQLVELPDSVVIVDMIGDRDLNIYKERSSNQALGDEIWNMAEQSGYKEYFLPMAKYRLLDDHTPFINAGIPTVLVIDFDYVYWHTNEDTPDKISQRSLRIVGETLMTWLTGKLSN